MRGFVVVKNIKSPLEDVLITGDIPVKNVDYMLLADVSLLEKRVKQVEAEDEDEDVTFIFEPTGRLHLVKKDPNAPDPTTEYGIVAGHLTESPANP